VNKRKFDLLSEKYLKRFWLWYSILLITLPSIKVILDFIDTLETECIKVNFSAIRTISGYFFLLLLAFVGFLAMEYSRMYGKTHRINVGRYSEKRFKYDLMAFFVFIISVAIMIGVHYVNFGKIIFYTFQETIFVC